MSILGKILLVFNLLAGAGFVYLALEDWTKRQNAAASLLRHQMYVQGLPFEGGDIPAGEDPEIPFRSTSAAGISTETVSKKFLETYFAGVGAPSKLGGTEVVASQLAEVKRARQRVRQLLDGAGANKARATAAFLEPMVETLDERDAIDRLLEAGKADELFAMLMARFDAVEDASKSKDITEREMKAAHLLVHLDTEQSWQKRVALVLGLRRYKSTIIAQTIRFERMLAQLQRLIEQDQNGYNEAIRTLEKQAITRTERLMDSAKRLKAAQDQKAKDAEFLKQIETQVANLTARFQQVESQVNATLVQQSTAEQKLFDYQQMVGATLVEIFRLEDQLARRERDQAGVKP